mmetsp:Transcript_18954/g.34221  ORF Transcript_18954/g.34221 Transcript_18954/m.34221 type:complete len:130 (-) Transcript_18954:62-451(-)
MDPEIESLLGERIDKIHRKKDQEESRRQAEQEARTSKVLEIVRFFLKGNTEHTLIIPYQAFDIPTMSAMPPGFPLLFLLMAKVIPATESKAVSYEKELKDVLGKHGFDLATFQRSDELQCFSIEFPIVK